MGTFKGGGIGVLEGRSLSLMTITSGFFTEATPLLCCVTVLLLLLSVLFTSAEGGGGGGAISITSRSVLASDLLASMSAEDKP